MASEQAANRCRQWRRSTCENTSPAPAGRGGATGTTLAPPLASLLDEYRDALDRAPLSPESRRTYLSKVRRFLAWLAAVAVDGDPFADAAARDCAVRDYRSHLQAVAKAAPATVNGALAAIDDLYARRGLGRANAERADLTDRAPRALGSGHSSAGCVRSRPIRRAATALSQASSSTPGRAPARPWAWTSTTPACPPARASCASSARARRCARCPCSRSLLRHVDVAGCGSRLCRLRGAGGLQLDTPSRRPGRLRRPIVHRSPGGPPPPTSRLIPCHAPLPDLAPRHDAGAMPHGDPARGVKDLSLPALEPLALDERQGHSLKHVGDRLEGFRRLKGRRYAARHHRGKATPMHRHARPVRDRAIVFCGLSPGLRRAELVRLHLDQVEPPGPGQLRTAKRARLPRVRGKGGTERTVFLSADARDALADYLEHERPGEANERSIALFLAAHSISSRQPGGRLSVRTIADVCDRVGAWHDGEQPDPERQLSGLHPPDLRHTFGFRLAAETGNDPHELERRLGHRSQRYIARYTNPPEHVSASFDEDL